MRIIAGEFRSRRIETPEGTATRPTPDRLRESMFSILRPHMTGETVFADLYAGCGAVGMEALSRGAARALFLEKDPGCVRLIRSNLAALGLESRARVIQGAVARHVEGLEADIYFLDPPYALEREYDLVLPRLEGLVIAQHDRRKLLLEQYGELRRFREVRQGDNCLSFYRSDPPR